MKKTFASLLFMAALGLASAHAAAQQTGRLVVEFQGPGGHSNGAYGRTSALHAASRTVIRIQQTLPAGSYVMTNLTGGNSVNSIASDGPIFPASAQRSITISAPHNFAPDKAVPFQVGGDGIDAARLCAERGKEFWFI